MEGSYQVLARRHVDRGLAADAGVDHRGRRRGDLDVRHAAHVRRRHVPHQVAHHAAAQGQHARVAIAEVGEHEVLDGRLDGAALTALACRHLVRQQHLVFAYFQRRLAAAATQGNGARS